MTLCTVMANYLPAHIYVLLESAKHALTII